MDIVVYTCVTDRYDAALMPATAEPGVSFICFTDRPGSSITPGWEVRSLQSPPCLTRGHEINRFHKFFPHHIFPDVRWSIYLDGNVRIDGELSELVEAISREKAEIGAFRHPNGHTLRTEAEVCALSKLDAWDFARLEDQLAINAADGVDLNSIIPACYILVRDHGAPRLASAMSFWWSQIFEYTKRDQMSFPRVLKVSGLTFQMLDDGGFINPQRVHRANHARLPLWRRTVRRAKRTLLRQSQLPS